MLFWWGPLQGESYILALDSLQTCLDLIIQPESIRCSLAKTHISFA